MIVSIRSKAPEALAGMTTGMGEIWVGGDAGCRQAKRI
jgi:hypothetical protein